MTLPSVGDFVMFNTPDGAERATVTALLRPDAPAVRPEGEPRVDAAGWVWQSGLNAVALVLSTGERVEAQLQGWGPGKWRWPTGKEKADAARTTD